MMPSIVKRHLRQYHLGQKYCQPFQSANCALRQVIGCWVRVNGK